MLFLLALPCSALPGMQEIYFASRWKLMIGLITGAQDTFSLTSDDSDSCNCATFVAKITDASELLRLFQCAGASD